MRAHRAADARVSCRLRHGALQRLRMAVKAYAMARVGTQMSAPKAERTCTSIGTAPRRAEAIRQRAGALPSARLRVGIGPPLIHCVSCSASSMATPSGHRRPDRPRQGFLFRRSRVGRPLPRRRYRRLACEPKSVDLSHRDRPPGSAQGIALASRRETSRGSGAWEKGAVGKCAGGCLRHQ